VTGRAAYLTKVPGLRDRLTAKPAMSGAVNYGF